MNQVIIYIPTPFQRFLGGETFVPVKAATLREVLEALAARSNDLRDAVFDPEGKLRRFIRISVNGNLITPQEGLDKTMAEGAEVTLILAIAGG